MKPPLHVGRSETAIREWEEVEVRTRALARLERIWGKSGGVGAGSSSNLSTSGGMTSSGLSAGGEEREKRLFCEALRDGFVLCQCVFEIILSFHFAFLLSLTRVIDQPFFRPVGS